MADVPGAGSPARRPPDRLVIVEHVHGTADLQETDWLEWKSGYDLTKAAGRAATAKHILGFANRIPDAAARNAGGYGYLLLGVEPGMYHGMPVHDSADIENWLRPYVGDKVLYDIDYVTADGKKVLFITVDPPQAGDDIHPLRKAGEDADNAKTVALGTVFVRKSGKTERASDADIDRLTERARRQGATLALSLEVAAPVPALPANCLDDEFRDAYLEARKRKLLSEVPRRRDPLMPFTASFGETRSAEAFTGEVERFVEEARASWLTFALVKAVEEGKPGLEFVLVNPTDDNFEAVQVEVTLPLPPALVFAAADDARDRAKPPEEPSRWGRRYADLTASIRPPSTSFLGPDIQPVDDKHTTVRFNPVHARPRTRHTLPEVIVAALPQLAGKTLKATWRATSTSTRGELTGEVDITINASPPAPTPR